HECISLMGPFWILDFEFWIATGAGPNPKSEIQNPKSSLLSSPLAERVAPDDGVHEGGKAVAALRGLLPDLIDRASVVALQAATQGVREQLLRQAMRELVF